MRIYRECSSIMHTNTYIVVEGKGAFVVDPGDEQVAQSIRDTLKLHGAKLEAILITHAHFDHIAGVEKLKRMFEDAQVYAHRESVEYINGKKNLGKYLGVKVEPFNPDILLDGGEKFSVAGMEIEAIYTPGHSKDGVCYMVGDSIFSGDTIFYCTYGRTDLFDGDLATLRESAKKLFALEGNYALLPGHGEPSELDFEREHNPILSNSGDDDE